MSRSFDAVLLDMDGVLLHSYDAWFHLVNDVAEAFGKPPISATAFARGWGQGVQADARTWFAGRTVAEVEAEYTARLEAHLDQIRVEPEAASTVDRLREALPVAVVTNTPGEMAGGMLRHAGIEPDVLVGGTDVPRAKPAPDMLLEACRRLGVAPQRALMVGDSRFDREAADAAGASFAGYGTEGRWNLGSLAEVLDLVQL